MTVLALLVKAGWPAVLSLPAAVLLGAAVGAANGLALTRLHLPHPFIATLATLNVARGATYLLSGGVPISGLTPEVRWLGSADVVLFEGSRLATSLPVSFLVVVALYGAVAGFMRKTPTGRHIYAVGGSPRAAQYAGIDVARLLVLVYVLCGAMAGVAGVLLAGRVNSAYPTAGLGAELDIIAAVIIGGASFFGGRGSPGGVFLGAVVMGLVRNGLNLMNVSVFWQQVLIGLIILLAVYVDVLRRRSTQMEL
jgi:ribose transport system permease protein